MFKTVVVDALETQTTEVLLGNRIVGVPFCLAPPRSASPASSSAAFVPTCLCCARYRDSKDQKVCANNITQET